MNSLTKLTAISPIDGRYRNTTEKLADYFSESALINYRVLVEIEYFIALCELPLPQLKAVGHSVFPALRTIYENFTEEDAQQIKDIEKITNHDVKAVEYFLKEKFDALGLNEQKEFIHFGLTSQDINNTAIPLSIMNATKESILPELQEIVKILITLGEDWKSIPMLARTHGQPASPTRLGKEIEVFAARLESQIKQLKAVPFSAKFGGATGNMNAHHVAYPEIDWLAFATNFVNVTLDLHRSYPTTQIEHYDNFAAYCDALKRINTILIDLNRDVWQHFSAKLPISRWQRDLTDSTVLRNVGVPLAHSLIAYSSLKKGLNKLILNEEALKKDLDNNWAVVAEAIQTVLRREGYSKPYEALKELTRTNAHITKESIAAFIDTLKVNDAIKTELKMISPGNYTGI